MNDYEVKRNHFSLAKFILWEDIIDKLNYEFAEKTHKTTLKILSPHSEVMHTDYLPNSIGTAYAEVCEVLRSKCVCTCIRLLVLMLTLSRHNDNEEF